MTRRKEGQFVSFFHGNPPKMNIVSQAIKISGKYVSTLVGRCVKVTRQKLANVSGFGQSENISCEIESCLKKTQKAEIWKKKS